MKNDTGASPISGFRGNIFAALDWLPLPLRQAINEGVCAWDPRVVRWGLNKRLKSGEALDTAIAGELQDLRLADDNEVRLFCYHWPSRFGRYPHIAAGATILRYDEADKVRRARADA